MTRYPVPALCSALLRRGDRRGSVCGAVAVFELLAMPSLPRYRCESCAALAGYPPEILRALDAPGRA